MEKVQHRRRRFWTIPNVLSLLRMALIPFILYEYLALGHTVKAGILLIVSSLTDLADGFIARHFNMVSDWGKLLDPVADKLTQVAVLMCACTKFPRLWVLVGLLAVKELAMFLMGVVIYRMADVVNSAQWFGKISTVVLVGTLIAVLVFENLSVTMVDALIVLCACSILVSFLLYFRFYYSCYKTMRAGGSVDWGKNRDKSDL